MKNSQRAGLTSRVSPQRDIAPNASVRKRGPVGEKDIKLSVKAIQFN